MYRKILSLLMMFVTTLCISTTILASVPSMINYQGKLMQPSGSPVADGTYSMQFAIYDVPTGGTALWSETNPNVQVKSGLFSVFLGNVKNLPASVFDIPSRFFGITVGTDTEMSPRQQIASVVFAMKAMNADLATNAQSAQTVVDGAITTAKIADGAITTAKLENGIVITSPQYQGNVDGWVAANETWQYASPTSITVPSDAAAKYSVGDKIKLAQSAVKYFYIIGVSATTLTITGGSDYTLTNAPISSNYYSKVASPVGFPQWFNWVPTLYNVTSPTVNVARFCLTGKLCTVETNMTVTVSGTLYVPAFSSPVPIKNGDIGICPGTAFIYDSGGQGYAGTAFTTNTFNIMVKKFDGDMFAQGVGKILFKGSYEY